MTPVPSRSVSATSPRPSTPAAARSRSSGMRRALPRSIHLEDAMPDAEPVLARVPKFEIYQDPARAPRVLQSWSFRVDGHESLMWFASEAAAKRYTTRLLAGRSNEAFGDPFAKVRPPTVVAGDQTIEPASPKARGKVEPGGEVTTETVEMKS